MARASRDLADLDRRVRALTGARGKVRAPRDLQRILVGVDGSKPSLQAADWAAALAKGGKGQVGLVAVAPPQVGRLGSEWSAVLKLARGTREEAQGILDDAVARLRRQRVKAKAAIEEGSPVPRLLAAARSARADLVAVGARGTGSAGPLHLGSVADALRNRAPCSVLVAQGAPDGKGGVLAATDGSAASRRAVALSARVADLLGKPLTVLHAIDVPEFNRQRPSAASVLASLDAAVRKAEEDGDARTRFRVAAGPAAQTILDATRKERSALVVVGSRGRGGLRSLVLGSVSSQVSEQARCSVLVVKG